MRNLLAVVLRKELLDASRDKRSLSTLLMLVFLMPLMVFFSLQFAIKKATQNENETIKVIILQGEQVPTLQAQLKQAGVSLQVEKLKDEAAITERLKDRNIAAVIDVAADFRQSYDALRPATLNLWFNSASEQNGKINKVKRLLQRYQRGIAEWRLVAHGTSPSLVTPLDYHEFDVAGQGERAGAFLGVMFGMMFWAVFGIGTTMIIDTTAGERERRTIELLLAQPVRARQIVGGKWLAAAILSFFGLLLEMSATHLALLKLPLEEIGMSWQLGVSGLSLILLSGIPLCLFAAAFTMAMSMNTKSFKEAQATVGIAMLVPMLPVIVVPMLDLGKQTWMFAIPVLGHGEVVKTLAKGQQVLPIEWALLLGVPLLISLLLVVFCTWRMQSERFVVGV